MRPCVVRSCLAGLALVLGCRGEGLSASASSRPGAPALAPSSPAPSAPAPSLPASSPPNAPSAASVGSASAAPASTGPSAQASDESLLLGPDGRALPQTEERPPVGGERFERRMKLLAEAILTGDADKGRAAFFPLVAYEQVKDVQKPERDYRYRLMANFERDVREYRKALGKDAEGAEFVGVEVPEQRVQWMKPGKEGNRLGYFRVLRSKLRFRLSSGKERSLELTSMISWRGEWYVVHLHGFK